MPKISNGGKTYTLILRKGLKYSDGTPVKASDFTFAVERMFKLNSGGSPFYTDIVGAEKFAEDEAGRRSPGSRPNDKTGEIVINLVKPRGTFTNELGADVRRAAAPRTRRSKNLSADPPPGDRALRDHQAPSRARGWEYERNPLLGEGQREADARHPERPRRQDRHHGHPQPVDPGQRQSNRASTTGCRTRRRPTATRKSKSKYEGTQFRVEPTISTYYFWMNTTQAAVRRPQGAPGGQLRGRPRSAGTDLRRPDRPRTQQILPPGMPGYKTFDLYPHDMAKAKELIAEANPSDRDITVWTDTESPNNEAGEYYQDVLEETRLQREAENHQRRQLLHGDRQRDRRPTSTPAGSTGSRTTRTRTTSSSRCWPAKASCRPTTTTSPTSTTRS